MGMIERIEQLLVHWGEQCRRRGLAVSLGSPLGAMMDWRGAPPRTGYGSRSLIGGAGVDHLAAEVDAAVAELLRRGEAEDKRLAKAWAEAGQRGAAPICLQTQLMLLARVRYLVDPAPLVEQQMKRCRIASARTYDRRVQQLHEWVRDELKRRAEARAA